MTHFLFLHKTYFSFWKNDLYLKFFFQIHEDVKFALGIKNINFGFTLTLITFPSPVNKITGILLGGIRTHELCNSGAVSYQLDH